MFDDIEFLLQDFPSSFSDFVSTGIAYFFILLILAYVSKRGFAYLVKFFRKVVAYVRNARTYYGNRNGGTN